MTEKNSRGHVDPGRRRSSGRQAHTLQTGWDARHTIAIDILGPSLPPPSRALDRAADVSAALRDLLILLAGRSGYLRPTNKNP